jgi:glycosyltransferase involved in cell wall biosynthesis
VHGARPRSEDLRVLVVASPLVSRGGVYGFLVSAVPALMERCGEVGLLWSSRVPADELPGTWTRRFREKGRHSLARQRSLYLEVRQAVTDWRPDVLLSVLPQSDRVCARIASNEDLAWVAMVHGQPFPASGEARALHRIPWKLALRRAYRRAARVVTVSEELAAQLQREFGIAAPDIVPTGVRLVSDAQPHSRSEPVLGFVGRLAVEKGADIFVEVARLVDCEAHVYGDGPLGDELRRAAGGNPRLLFHGWQDRDAAFRAIDVLLLPSRREGLPLVLLEAGARSVCAVARSIGGVPEILGRDELLASNCLLPTDASPEEFSLRVGQLLQDRALREQLAGRLKAVVSREFDADRQFDRLATVLHAAAPSAAQGAGASLRC